MQALALVHGGHVQRAPEPVHGRLSVIEHTGDDPLFQVCVVCVCVCFGLWPQVVGCVYVYASGCV